MSNIEFSRFKGGDNNSLLLDVVLNLFKNPKNSWDPTSKEFQDVPFGYQPNEIYKIDGNENELIPFNKPMLLAKGAEWPYPNTSFTGYHLKPWMQENLPVDNVPCSEQRTRREFNKTCYVKATASYYFFGADRVRNNSRTHLQEYSLGWIFSRDMDDSFETGFRVLASRFSPVKMGDYVKARPTEKFKNNTDNNKQLLFNALMMKINLETSITITNSTNTSDIKYASTKASANVPLITPDGYLDGLYSLRSRFSWGGRNRD